MNTSISKNVPVSSLSTFKLGGSSRFMASVRTVDELKLALQAAKEENVPIFILGGGSNTLFEDGLLDIFIIKIEIPGIEKISEDESSFILKIGAGEEWDKVVGYAVENGLSGIETLSLIPGTAGATPVQNVGAYGQEIKETLLSVEVIDKNTGEIIIFSNEECQFSYRTSIFKKKDNPFIILSIILKLSKKAPQAPHYPELVKYFENKNISTPTLKQIRDAVIEIRTKKLPDLKSEPNTGSFFKNAIISSEQAEELKKQFPDMPQFPAQEGIKIPSGWLIDQAGYKGKTIGTIRVSDKNALVLINNGEATFADLAAARDEIITAVFEKFGIRLEQEPVIVSKN